MFQRKLPPLLALAILVCAAHGLVAVAQEPAAATATTPPSLPELIRLVKPSVVSVVTFNAKNEALMSGSGFFIRHGQVVTNLHVIEGAHRAEVRTFDGKGKTYPVAGVLDVDEEGDLAVLSINVPADRTHSIEIAKSLPEEGERIFVIGSPLRLEGSVSDGIVSAVREVPNLGKIVQITAPISHGNSGSPVFNMKGQVIGVVTVKVTNGQNINLAIDTARVAARPVGEKLQTFEELAARSRTGLQSEALADWWYRNGLNSLWLGNYETALSNFENAIDKNPNRVETWIQVGFCKVKQGKNGEAIRAYQQAIRLRPNSVEAYNKLGDAYYFAGNYNKAIEAYAQAARIEPRNSEAYYNLGMTYLEIGDRGTALAHSRTLKPLDAELYKKLLREIER
ncbi:MAG TPA: tetratricopeptide repeat-containing serine protease family protein [Pyrinomonadaceae bacterium]|jgi:tetratricopeptide (TPR) repeat protein|nr:tetratricopeptide repeat-containing serine protease family protein [Pyrinomonadaceae bacterium]